MKLDWILRILSSRPNLLSSFVVVVLLGCVFLLADPGASSESNTPSNAQDKQSIQELNVTTTEPEMAGQTDSGEWWTVQSDFLRSIKLDELILSTDLDGLTHLLDQANHLSNFASRFTAKTRIVEGISARDPLRALELAQEFPIQHRSVLLSTIFHEWILADLDSAVEHAKPLDEQTRKLFVTALFYVREDLGEDVRRSIATSLSLKDFARELLLEAQVASLMEQPEEAFQAIQNDSVPDSRQMRLLEEVALEWIDRDGMEVFSRLGEQLTFEDRENLRYGVTRSLTQRDAPAMFAYAKTSLGETDFRVWKTILNEWVRWDAPAAFDAINQLSSEELGRTLRESVVSDWARNNPFELLDYLDTFPQDIRLTAEEQAIQFATMMSPKKAAIHLASLDGNQDVVVQNFVSGWAMQDPTAALDWVLGSPQLVDTRQELFNLIVDRMPIENADRLMNEALAIPIGESGVGAEVGIVRWLAREDIDKALLALSQTREGQTKLDSYREVGWELVRRDRNQDAIGLADQLRDEQRASFIRTMAPTIVASDPENIQGVLEMFESTEGKSSVALAALTFHGLQEFLSEQQVTDLTKLLLPEDVEQLKKGFSLPEDADE